MTDRDPLTIFEDAQRLPPPPRGRWTLVEYFAALGLALCLASVVCLVIEGYYR